MYWRYTSLSKYTPKDIKQTYNRDNITIEEHHRCFGLGGYFMAAVLAAAIYSRRGFSPFLAGSARRVMVPGGSTFHLEPVTIHPFWNLTDTGCL